MESVRSISFAINGGAMSDFESVGSFLVFVLGRAAFFFSLGLGGWRLIGIGRLDVVL